MKLKALARDVLRLDVHALHARLRSRLHRLLYRHAIGMRIRLQFARARAAERQIKAFDAMQVPIIINCYNRLLGLKEQLAWLESAGLTRVILLDNASTYGPLLEFYRATKCRVVHLGGNVGPSALWRSRLFREIRRGYYVYTDPDVVPVENCPKDILERMYAVLRRHPDRAKVGLGLKVDDLPSHYDRAQEVVAWEARFWERPLEPDVYDAPVDTTFALYRPFTGGPVWLPAVRTGPPLLARHLPWYADSRAPDEEERFYRTVVRTDASHWMTGRRIRRP